jgi:hypothetical protein
MPDHPETTQDGEERFERARAKLAEALLARETPFQLATLITACWRYSIGDDDGAAYGLVGERGDLLWKFIEQALEFERGGHA